MQYKIEVEYRKSFATDEIYTFIEYLDTEEYEYPEVRSRDGIVTVGSLSVLSSNFITSKVTEVPTLSDAREELPHD